MNVRYPLRRAVALTEAALGPAVAALVVLTFGALSDGSALAVAVVFALLLLPFGALGYRRARRRTLHATDEGLLVQRDRYRLLVPWDHVTGVGRRRHELVFVVDELHVRDAQVVALDGRGRPTTPPRGIGGHAATTRIMISMYDRDWRDGPVGARVRSVGVA